eukprot:10579076-Ditylum_brightwellii.AAC.1
MKGDGKPFIGIGDAKHCKKLGRNSFQSGAQALQLGKHDVDVCSIQEVQSNLSNLLVKMDVFNTDMQDDGAAYHAFQSDTMAAVSNECTGSNNIAF